MTTTITVEWCWSKAIFIAYQSSSARGREAVHNISVNVWPILCKYLHHVLPIALGNKYYTYVRCFLQRLSLKTRRASEIIVICTTSWMNRTIFVDLLFAACCQKKKHWNELICWMLIYTARIACIEQHTLLLLLLFSLLFFVGFGEFHW